LYQLIVNSCSFLESAQKAAKPIIKVLFFLYFI
jgi:hypothetical protein